MINIEKVKQRISELSLSKKQVLDKCGFTRVTLDKILSGGDINVKTLEALAKGLDMKIGFLFDEEQTNSISSDNKDTLIYLMDMIKEKDNIIRGQCELIGRLKEMVGKQEEKYDESSFSSLENAVENAL